MLRNSEVLIINGKYDIVAVLLTFTTAQDPGIIITIKRFDPSKISDRIFSFPLKDRCLYLDGQNMGLLAQFLSFDNLLASVLTVSIN